MRPLVLLLAVLFVACGLSNHSAAPPPSDGGVDTVSRLPDSQSTSTADSPPNDSVNDRLPPRLFHHRRRAGYDANPGYSFGWRCVRTCRPALYSDKSDFQEKFKSYKHGGTGLEVSTTAEEGIGFLDAFKTPGIIKYAITYAFIKSSSYGLLFWLSDYLKTVIGFTTETAYLTGAYEIGQMLGAIGLGLVSDRAGKRVWIIMISLYLSAGLYLVLANLDRGASATEFGIILFGLGMLFGGSEALLSGAVVTDRGEKYGELKNVRAVGTMVGIVDGTGAMGGALTQIIIPKIKNRCFSLFLGCCVVAAVIYEIRNSNT